MTRQLEAYISLASIWGVSRAGQKLAAVAAHKPGELPKLISTEYRTQAAGSPCTVFDICNVINRPAMNVMNITGEGIGHTRYGLPLLGV